MTVAIAFGFGQTVEEFNLFSILKGRERRLL